jgi:hypothetical protein
MTYILMEKHADPFSITILKPTCLPLGKCVHSLHIYALVLILTKSYFDKEGAKRIKETGYLVTGQSFSPAQNSFHSESLEFISHNLFPFSGDLKTILGIPASVGKILGK